MKFDPSSVIDCSNYFQDKIDHSIIICHHEAVLVGGISTPLPNLLVVLNKRLHSGDKHVFEKSDNSDDKQYS